MSASPASASLTHTAPKSGLSRASTSNLLYVGVALGLLLLVVLLSYWGAAAATETSKPSARFEHKLRSLVHEAQQWSVASQQDANPLVSLVHATYGMAYMRVARTLASDADIERVCNLRLDEFAGQLSDAQQVSLRNVAGQCKSLATPGLSSLNTGWLATEP